MPRLGVRLWLDGLIAALTVAAISAAIVFKTVRAATGGDTAAIGTNLAYPLADMVLFGIVVGVMAAGRSRLDRTWIVLGARLRRVRGLRQIYLFQVARETYVTGTVLDLGWIVGALIISLAAWQPGPPRDRADRRRAEHRRSPSSCRSAASRCSCRTTAPRPRRSRVAPRRRVDARGDLPARGHASPEPREPHLLPPPGAHRLADRARQPPQAAARPRGRAPTTCRSRTCCCCSTSTASSTTTTATATRRATRCCTSSGRSCRRRSRARRWPTGWAATSSACCAVGPERPVDALIERTRAALSSTATASRSAPRAASRASRPRPGGVRGAAGRRPPPVRREEQRPHLGAGPEQAVLLRAVGEWDAELSAHGEAVAALAAGTARELGPRRRGDRARRDRRRAPRHRQDRHPAPAAAQARQARRRRVGVPPPPHADRRAHRRPALPRSSASRG